MKVIELLTDYLDNVESIHIPRLQEGFRHDKSDYGTKHYQQNGILSSKHVYDKVKDFLSNGLQQVRVENTYTQVSSGISQGGILGPVLFTIFFL